MLFWALHWCDSSWWRCPLKSCCHCCCSRIYEESVGLRFVGADSLPQLASLTTVFSLFEFDHYFLIFTFLYSPTHCCLFFRFLNLLNSPFPTSLIFNLLGSPPHYFLIFNIFSSPTRHFLISNFLNSLTHQWAAKGRQRSRWKGRFFTSMCNLYSCTDHWKGK